MPLLNTFAPEEDESSLGYYRHLSSANRLENWKDLASCADVSRSRTGLLGRPQYIAEVLGLDPSWTRHVARQEDVVRGMRRLHRGLHDAVCPECLRGSCHIRAHWEHVYSTACPIHKTRLLDRCDRCGSSLLAARRKIEYCDCGRDLRAMAAETATEAQLWLSGLIAGSPQRRGRIAPALPHVPLDPLARLVRVLCMLYEPGAAAPQRNAAAPRSVAEAIEFLWPLESLLRGWPTGFQAHVEQRIRAGVPNTTTLNASLGSWYKQLKQLCTDGPLHPFLENVMVAASKAFPGLIGLDAAGHRGITEDKLILVKDAARRLGVGKDQVCEAIEGQLVQGHARRFGARRLAYQISEAEVDRVQAARSGWVDEKSACNLLDVPESVLRSLVASGAVTTDIRWREDIFKGGPVAVASAEELASSLRSHHAPNGDTDVTISLRGLTSRRVGDKHALQDAFRAIVRGEILCVGDMPNSGIGDLRYRLADIRRYFGTPLLEAGLTLRQLTELTGWKYESVCHWINDGLLEAESMMLRGQACRVVMPAQLLRFTRQYVVLADVAKALGTRASAAAKHLEGLTVVGAKRLPNGARRGGLVRLVDLANLAFVGARPR